MQKGRRHSGIRTMHNSILNWIIGCKEIAMATCVIVACKVAN